MTRPQAIRRALLPMLVVALPACGGGGGGSAAQASPVALSFPAGNATTDAETITIRGSVALTPPISSVKVNGVDAVSSDGFAHFSTTIPLSSGVHDLLVAVLRPNLPTETFLFEERVTRIDPIVGDPTDVAFDAAKGRLLVLDRSGHSIVAVDPASGARTLLSDHDHGSGTIPNDPISFDVDSDGAFAFVLDGANDSILKVNLANGTRMLLSGAGAGLGPDFVLPAAVAFDPVAERLLVADAGHDGVLAVNLKTGTRSIVSNDGHGSGPLPFLPSDLVVDAPTNRALVSDTDSRSILAIDLASGDRTVLSDFTHGSGDAFVSPIAVALNPFFGTLLVVDESLGRVVAVDLASGNRSILVDDEEGTGTEIGLPRAAAADVFGVHYVVDGSDDSLVRFDLLAQERVNFVEPPAVGSGPSLRRAGRVALDPVARVAWVAVEEPPAVVRVDLATGLRTPFSDAAHGQGKPFVEPVAIALDAARGRLLVADDDDDSLWSVSLRDGSRSLLSVEPDVPGFDLHVNFEVVIDDVHGRALLVQNRDLIVAVDLATGARSEFSFDDPVVFGATRMDGGALDLAHGRLLAHDQELGLFAASLADGTRSFVSTLVGGSGQDGGSGLAPDPAQERILITPRSPLPSGVGAVDPASGGLSMISTSDLGVGAGPVLDNAVALAPDFARGVALVFDSGTHALFEVDLETGDRVIVSR
jgi:DNA-binding beta-propeller fold protein YncE